MFGCSAQTHTLEDFGRTDGPPEAIAHGFLAGGPITLFAADATGDHAAAAHAAAGRRAPERLGHLAVHAHTDGGRVPVVPGAVAVSLLTRARPGRRVSRGRVLRRDFIAAVNVARPVELGLPGPVNLAFGAAFRRESYKIR